MYTYGHWPKGHLDHINRDRTDNRIENLRDITPAENQHNSNVLKNNTSGFRGVNWSSDMGKWVAKICINRKQIYLGAFKRVEDAANAYLSASKELHPLRFENLGC